jgi:hypothetical protein
VLWYAIAPLEAILGLANRLGWGSPITLSNIMWIVGWPWRDFHCPRFVPKWMHCCPCCYGPYSWTPPMNHSHGPFLCQRPMPTAPLTLPMVHGPSLRTIPKDLPMASNKRLKSGSILLGSSREDICESPEHRLKPPCL